jgi:hypothetical protein
MSTINTESVLSAISSYNSENKRPCPAKFLRDAFGEVDDAIESLKASGVVIARRGRNGGLTVAAPVVDSVQEPVDEPIASVG